MENVYNLILYSHTCRDKETRLREENVFVDVQLLFAPVQIYRIQDVDSLMYKKTPGACVVCFQLFLVFAYSVV